MLLWTVLRMIQRVRWKVSAVQPGTEKNRLRSIKLSSETSPGTPKQATT